MGGWLVLVINWAVYSYWHWLGVVAVVDAPRHPNVNESWVIKGMDQRNPRKEEDEEKRTSGRGRKLQPHYHISPFVPRWQMRSVKIYDTDIPSLFFRQSSFLPYSGTNIFFKIPSWTPPHHPSGEIMKEALLSPRRPLSAPLLLDIIIKDFQLEKELKNG